jgi:MoaA/NifB/PqqE/SkfB family radical SAM enzyme
MDEGNKQAMTTLTRPDTTHVKASPAFSFLWLEITGRCSLGCSHCYAGSGPSGSHGIMTAGDWRSVISQAADLGVSMVQFMGGCLRARRVPYGLCLICWVW